MRHSEPPPFRPHPVPDTGVAARRGETARAHTWTSAVTQNVPRITRRFLRSGFLVLVSVVTGACGGAGTEKEEVNRPAAEPQPRAAAYAAPTEPRSGGRQRTGDEARGAGGSSPSIAIRRPKSARTVERSAVTVSVSVRRFRVVEQRTRPPFPAPVDGQGHVHFYLDTETLPTMHGPPATGAYRSIAGRSHTWRNLTPGRHSFAVQLVGKDHAPLSPPVKDRVTVDVE